MSADIRRPVVRPNRWDCREARMEDLLARAQVLLQKHAADQFDGADRVDNLDTRTWMLRAGTELAKPRHSDLDGRVRSPLVRWWRDRQVHHG